MMRYLLDLLLILAVLVVGICYCALAANSQYSRDEEARDFERWQQGGGQ